MMFRENHITSNLTATMRLGTMLTLAANVTDWLIIVQWFGGWGSELRHVYFAVGLTLSILLPPLWNVLRNEGKIDLPVYLTILLFIGQAPTYYSIRCYDRWYQSTFFTWGTPQEKYQDTKALEMIFEGIIGGTIQLYVLVDAYVNDEELTSNYLSWISVITTLAAIAVGYDARWNKLVNMKFIFVCFQRFLIVSSRCLCLVISTVIFRYGVGVLIIPLIWFVELGAWRWIIKNQRVNLDASPVLVFLAVASILHPQIYDWHEVRTAGMTWETDVTWKIPGIRFILDICILTAALILLDIEENTDAVIQSGIVAEDALPWIYAGFGLTVVGQADVFGTFLIEIAASIYHCGPCKACCFCFLAIFGCIIQICRGIVGCGVAFVTCKWVKLLCSSSGEEKGLADKSDEQGNIEEAKEDDPANREVLANGNDGKNYVLKR